MLPATVAVLMLVACGGGGGSEPPPGGGGEPPPPPTNNAPVALEGCSTTPQSTVTGLRGFLRATDSDSNANELTFSLDPNASMVTGPIQTDKGTVEILDVTTGEFIYTPNTLGPRGLDTFQFRVDDPESFALGVETVIINPAIMPLGDSITLGTFAGEIPPLETRVGYRRKLFDGLTNNGFMVDFVGGESNGEAAIPPVGDPQHEGHGGFTALQIAQNVRFWLMLNPADIVLLHAGTNTINSDNFDAVTRAGHVEQILDEIDQWELDTSTPVSVYVAKIIDRSNPDGTFQNARVIEYNQALENLVASRPDDDIEIVDQYSALDYSCADGSCDMVPQGNTAQYIHPSQAGYDKMASTWLNSGLLTSDKLARCQ
ncbi:MAG: hypothetical protein H0V34_00515 [Gammaproteobacteria bacterium]|nr:hypothetical protein [Gammaproteobacteria bacterium]